MNSKATADAIAARFTGVTATVNGATEGLVLCTASLPNTIAVGPVLLVYPPSGTLAIGVSQRRSDELDFPVRLLRDPLNVPLRTDALYAWYDALRDRVEANMDLDLAYVAWARCTEMRAELDGESYGGSLFDVVELVVRVRFDEVVTSVSV